MKVVVQVAKSTPSSQSRYARELINIHAVLSIRGWGGRESLSDARFNRSCAMVALLCTILAYCVELVRVTRMLQLKNKRLLKDIFCKNNVKNCVPVQTSIPKSLNTP